MWKQTDKQLHFLGGIILALVFGLFLGIWAGLAAAVIAGLAKEAYDSLGFGTLDKWDAVATVAGGIIGALVLFIAKIALVF